MMNFQEKKTGNLMIEAYDLHGLPSVLGTIYFLICVDTCLCTISIQFDLLYYLQISV